MAEGVGERPDRAMHRPTDFSRRNWWFVLKRVVVDIGEDDLMLVAAGCAFYAMLAIVPALTALVLVYGLVADPYTVGSQVETMTGVVPAEVQAFLSEQLERLVAQPATGLSWRLALAVALALWSASAGIKGILSALNVAYHEAEKRSLVTFNAVALTFTVGMILGLIIALIAIVGVPAVLAFVGLGAVTDMAVRLGRWPLIGALLMAGLAVLYRYGPSRARARLRWISVGAAVATVLWVAASIAFSWYVTNFGGYNATYGSLGAVIVVMLWLYISVFVILLGAKLDAEIEHETSVDTTTGPARPMGQRGAFVADRVAPHD